eukprot:347419-Hanusia_phi.AAC.1
MAHITLSKNPVDMTLMFRQTAVMKQGCMKHLFQRAVEQGGEFFIEILFNRFNVGVHNGDFFLDEETITKEGKFNFKSFHESKVRKDLVTCHDVADQDEKDTLAASSKKKGGRKVESHEDENRQWTPGGRSRESRRKADS